ncbi:MAG TPA: prepilin-type N-terminal cleavage/methylation domain-containing protein [Alicyclobacillus sp.]|nr:prepilin-type N-terminal cleavage/methylation domain-containing protein [Alicyclobacillus sp.]
MKPRKWTEKPHRHQDGFSLIEVLASLTIAAALLVGILEYFTDAYVGMRQDGTRSQAVSQTQQAMEATRAWLMDQYAQGNQALKQPGPQTVLPDDLKKYGFQATTTMSTVVTYTYQSGQNGPPGWAIGVTTTWQSRGQAKSYQVTSFFGEYDHAKLPLSP